MIQAYNYNKYFILENYNHLSLDQNLCHPKIQLKKFIPTKVKTISHKMNITQNIKDVKTIILGDSGVGKSSVLYRFIKDEFILGQEPTLGVGFKSKLIEIDSNSAFNFCIWDTAGQEKYRSLAPMYYRDA